MSRKVDDNNGWSKLKLCDLLTVSIARYVTQAAHYIRVVEGTLVSALAVTFESTWSF